MKYAKLNFRLTKTTQCINVIIFFVFWHHERFKEDQFISVVTFPSTFLLVTPVIAVEYSKKLWPWSVV